MNRECRKSKTTTCENRPTQRVGQFTVRNGAEVSGLIAHRAALRYRVDDNALRVGWRAVDI
jgi:hypothetical protein